jgi:hypothetical protein
MKHVVSFLFGSIYTFCWYTSILYNWDANKHPGVIFTTTFIIIGSVILFAFSLKYILENWDN